MAYVESLSLDVSGALRPFGESTTLPGEAYTSAEVLAWERRHLFAGAWTCLGRTSELRTTVGGTAGKALAPTTLPAATTLPASTALPAATTLPGAAAMTDTGEARVRPAAAATVATGEAPARRTTDPTAQETAGPATDPATGPATDPTAGPTAGRPEPGSVTCRAITVGDVGVLLTFTPSQVRAFANLCRHRGHELLPSGGTADRAAVVCPYHGWAYGLDGTLLAAPAMRTVASFDPAAHGLVPLPVVEWHGWLFVNAAGGARPFPEYVAGLDEIIGPYAPARLHLRARHEYTVAANWKLIVENYHECYHCPLIHPELCRVSPPTSGRNWTPRGAWVGGTMDLREHAATMSLDGRSRGVFIDGAPRRTVSYVGIFPNLLISAHPDYLMTHRLEPLAPDLTTVECCWYFPDGVADPEYAVEFWDLTNRQDWAACESVQLGMSSPHFRPGPLAPNEDAVYQWIRLIAQAYQDPSTTQFRAVPGSLA